MTVSVIIPSYQGATKIVHILESLSNQKANLFEIIVIVDGSTDNTIELLSGNYFKGLVKIIEQTNKGRAGARNAGAKLSSGELLIFYDDDMVPEVDSVGKHIQFHQNHSRAILTGNSPQKPASGESDFVRYRASISLKWTSDATYEGDLVLLQKHNLFMTAANCSLRKSVFQYLNGFDELLRDAEDKELAIRAHKLGIPIYFDKGNLAFHKEIQTCRSYISRLRQYAVANKIVNELHPEFAPRPRKVSGYHKVIYRFLASSLWILIIDHFNVFVLLPREWRYKFYDAVTFASSEVYPERHI
ncbi:MAG: glycosyltransferase family 2 protein [Bacteroidia bacterium]